jgi:hypothetical protein
MYAIGSIREDYLGYEVTRHEQTALVTDRRLVRLCSSELGATTLILSLMLSIGGAALFMFVTTAVYHNLDFSEALERLVKVEKNKDEDKYVYVSCQSRYPIGTQCLLSREGFQLGHRSLCTKVSKLQHLDLHMLSARLLTTRHGANSPNQTQPTRK